MSLSFPVFSVQLVSPGAWLSDLCQERYEVREKKAAKKVQLTLYLSCCGCLMLFLMQSWLLRKFRRSEENQIKISILDTEPEL